MKDTGKAVRVVVVDDAACLRERLSLLLSAVDGVEVVGTAGDVSAGLALVGEFQPHIVVSDLDLPGRSGIDFLKTIKLLPAAPLVIMLTNLDHPEARRRCLEMGADFYFYKFNEIEKVLDVCRDLVERRGISELTDDLPDQPGTVPFLISPSADTEQRPNRNVSSDSPVHSATLAARLEVAREEERKRIAREIHDELGQLLMGFKFEMARTLNDLKGRDSEPGLRPIAERIGALDNLLDDMVAVVQRICTELRPGVLDDLGLPAAIEWQAREFQKRTGLQCELKLELHGLAVDSERSTALFRIFQEVLTNIARHAGASRVKVFMKKAGPNLFLEVSDNGQGIEERRKQGLQSLGIVGMRERVVILGGDIGIEGRPGKGTTVRVRLPLPQCQPAPGGEILQWRRPVSSNHN